MLYYKKNILEGLKNAGYSSYKLRNEKVLNQTVIQQIRNGEIVSVKTIDKLCKLLKCQPGDLLAFKDD